MTTLHSHEIACFVANDRQRIGIASFARQRLGNRVISRIVIPLLALFTPFTVGFAANYLETFDDNLAQGWSGVAGTWQVSDGTVSGSAGGPAGIAVYTGGNWATDFLYQVRVRNDFTNYGNRAGAVYNYQDPANYYAVQFSPVAPPGDPPGPTAYLNRVTGGTTVTLQRAPFSGGESGVWFDVDVIRSGTGTTVKVNGVTVFNNVTQSELGAGEIGLITQDTNAQFDNVVLTETDSAAPLSENFDDGLANGWTMASGRWAIEGGGYRSDTLGSQDVAIYLGGSWATDFLYKARVRNDFTSYGNQAGVIYNYQDSANYYAVQFSPVAPPGDPPGPTAYLNRVTGGTTVTLQRAPFSGGATGIWFDVDVIRSGTSTTVKVNGVTIFDSATQSELGTGRVGLITTFTDAIFDNIGLTAPTAPFFCTFANTPTDCGFFEQKTESVPPLPPTVRATIVSSVARDGTTAVRLHTEPGDSNVYGSGAAERNDLTSSQDLTDGYMGQEHWWAHSFLLPQDFVVPPDSPPAPWGWYVVADFHDALNVVGAQGNHHVDVVSNEGMRLRVHGGALITNANDSLTIVNLGPPIRNVWYDFIYHVKWSWGTDGFFDVWMRLGNEAVATKLMEHRGPTLYVNNGVYFKLANYHTAFGAPSSVIHDRVIRGVTGDAVKPADVTLDPNPPTGLPTATMTSPAPETTIAGTVTLAANAADIGGGVVGVQFKYSNASGIGSNIGAEDLGAPYEATWDTTTVPNGTYSVMATGRDTNFNQTTSAPVTVTVAN